MKIKGEGDIQSEVIEDLHEDGWFVIKILVANKSGFTDLIAFKYGRIVWIEIKVPGKELEPLQEFRRDQLIEHKLEHFIFYSRDDVNQLIV